MTGRAAAALVTGLAFGAAVTLYRFDPAAVVWFPPCPFRTLTDLLCPGCGSLRAIHALLHGELLRALAWNPFTTLGLPLLAVGSLKELRRWCVGGAPAAHRVPAWLIGALAFALVAFAVLRNVAS